MKSEIKKSEGLVREMEIEVDVEKVTAAFNKVYDKYLKEANIPGFRPGKAPLNIIKTKFSEAAREDVLLELVEESYQQALKEQNLRAATYPTFPEINLQENQSLRYTARFEVFPEVNNINYDGLTLPKNEFQVQDPEVDVIVNFLRRKHSTLSRVEREILDGDVIIADLTKAEDNAGVLKENEFADTEIDLGSSIIVKEFRDILPGHKVGDQVDVAVTYPEDYGNNSLAGKAIKYGCKIKEVKERILPETNDDFARLVGETQTYLELRLKIREDLKKQKNMDHEKWERNEIQRQFIINNNFPVPEGMISEYLERMYEERSKEAQPMDKEAFLGSYRAIAENGLRWTLLTNKIARDEKIEVLPEDTENWIKGFAGNYNLSMEQAKKILSESGRIQEIRESIMDEKMMDFLHKKVSFVPESEFVERFNPTEGE